MDEHGPGLPSRQRQRVAAMLTCQELVDEDRVPGQPLRRVAGNEVGNLVAKREQTTRLASHNRQPSVQERAHRLDCPARRALGLAEHSLADHRPAAADRRRKFHLVAQPFQDLNRRTPYVRIVVHHERVGEECHRPPRLAC